MNDFTLPRSRALPLAPHGDLAALRFCMACDIGDICLAESEADHLRRLEARVEHTGSYRPGQYLFREGEPLTSLSIVRTGTVKLFVVEPCGTEQVLGFALPGEAIGLDAFHDERHGCHAVALETVALCQLPLGMLNGLCAQVPRLQRNVLNLLSRHIAKAHLLVGCYAAEQRLAAFIVLLSRHAERRGLSPRQLHLGMARVDIANYLRLTPETISRVLRRFQDDALLQVNRRELEVLDLPALNELARSILRG